MPVSVRKRVAAVAVAVIAAAGGVGITAAVTADNSPKQSPIVEFSSLTGTTDSVKFNSFVNQWRDAPLKPTLEFDEMRKYRITEPSPLLFQGFAMIGGANRPVDQSRSQNTAPQIVQLRLPETSGDGWLRVPDGDVWDITITNLSFDATGTGANRLFAPNPKSTLWLPAFENVSYANGPGVLGSATVTQPIDGLTWGGTYSNINNIQNATTGTAFNIAGADNRINPSRMYVSSPPSLMDSTGDLIRLNSLSKTTISGLYVTAEQHGAIVVKGTNRALRITQSEIEGRLADHPSYGALVRVNGSDLTLTDTWFGFAMSNPNSASGGATVNRGVVDVVKGNVIVDRVQYASGKTSTTVPFIYQQSGTLQVSHVFAKDAKGVPFTPIVKVGPTVRVIADASVTVERVG